MFIASVECTADVFHSKCVTAMPFCLWRTRLSIARHAPLFYWCSTLVQRALLSRTIGLCAAMGNTRRYLATALRVCSSKERCLKTFLFDHNATHEDSTVSISQDNHPVRMACLHLGGGAEVNFDVNSNNLSIFLCG